MTSSNSVLLLMWVTLASLSTVFSHLVELSYTYNIDAPTTPKLRAFTYKMLRDGFNDYNVWQQVGEFCTSEHSGTHLDAPVHFAKDQWTVHEVPLERLWRVPGIVIDVSTAVDRSEERNYPIKVEDLEVWETDYGTIPDGAVVFVRTGWGSKVKNLTEYTGLDEKNQNNFPGLSKEAATWLATYGTRHNLDKGVVGVGVDTISVDVGNSVLYAAHEAMYSRSLYGLENVANMDQLPPKGFQVTVLPMRIGGGSGAPARIIAEVPDERSHSPEVSYGYLTLLLPLLIVVPLLKYGFGF